MNETIIGCNVSMAFWTRILLLSERLRLEWGHGE